MEIVNIDGTRNCRDLGGTIGAGGKAIVPKKFIRGIRLVEIEEAPFVEMAIEYNIHTILDLRNEHETEKDPDPSYHVCSEGKCWSLPVKQISIMADELRGIKHDGSFDMKKFITDPPTMEEIYARIIEDADSQQAFRDSLDLVFSEHPGSVYFHCSEGKDRTGLLAMFIQEILGVSRKDIYDDYVFSNEAPTPRRAQFVELALKLTADKEIAENAAKLMEVDASYLDSAYATMDELCGSVQGYIAEVLKFDEARIEDCRNRFLK